jgi:hypothetical protein
MNIYAGPGVAVRRFSVQDGEADYLLYADGKVIGVLEAKPAEYGMLTSVEPQSSHYVSSLPAGIPAHWLPVPFHYESTGTVTQFTNLLDPAPRSRLVFAFHRPEELLRQVSLDRQLRQTLIQMPTLDDPRLWSVQHQAVTNLEKSLAHNRPRALVQMATGSGKTFAYERPDFWTTNKNKQLNFLQHVKNLLKVNGRCAIVVPDNVLFEGGAGETVRRKLLEQCDVHTLLRLPTGLFYAQGVKANVLFFDARPAQEKAWTSKLWVYDLRTNMHFTLKTKPLRRADLDEFVDCYRPGKRHLRKPTWGEENPQGRWRCFGYDELLKRDKLNLDLFWLKDESLEDSESLPEPDVLAEEIAEDLQTALDLFSTISKGLKS